MSLVTTRTVALGPTVALGALLEQLHDAFVDLWREAYERDVLAIALAQYDYRNLGSVLASSDEASPFESALDLARSSFLRQGDQPWAFRVEGEVLRHGADGTRRIRFREVYPEVTGRALDVAHLILVDDDETSDVVATLVFAATDLAGWVRARLAEDRPLFEARLAEIADPADRLERDRTGRLAGRALLEAIDLDPDRLGPEPTIDAYGPVTLDDLLASPS